MQKNKTLTVISFEADSFGKALYVYPEDPNYKYWEERERAAKKAYEEGCDFLILQSCIKPKLEGFINSLFLN